jgi:diacylglycerol O-acyltransferase / wax synthase
LNITVQSYQDKLNFAITADRRAVPDPQALADLFEPALEDLKQALAKLAPAG